MTEALSNFLRDAITLAKERGVEVRVSAAGAVTIKPIATGENGQPLDRRSDRNRRYYEAKRLKGLNNEQRLTGLNASESVLKRLNSDGGEQAPLPPAPSLPLPPAPPSPAHPHPPTPGSTGVREEAKGAPDRFDEFWKLYPRREAKADAIKAWRKIKPEEIESILAAVPKHAASASWLKNDGQYIPLPASWLNARRWEDEGIQLGQQSDVRPLQQGYEDPPFLSDNNAIFHLSDRP